MYANKLFEIGIIYYFLYVMFFWELGAVASNGDRFLQVFKAFDLEQTCGAELEFFMKNPQTFLNSITFSTRF
jgi:hypothetical protein